MSHSSSLSASKLLSLFPYEVVGAIVEGLDFWTLKAAMLVSRDSAFHHYAIPMLYHSCVVNISEPDDIAKAGAFATFAERPNRGLLIKRLSIQYKGSLPMEKGTELRLLDALNYTPHVSDLSLYVAWAKAFRFLETHPKLLPELRSLEANFSLFFFPMFLFHHPKVTSLRTPSQMMESDVVPTALFPNLTSINIGRPEHSNVLVDRPIESVQLNCRRYTPAILLSTVRSNIHKTTAKSVSLRVSIVSSYSNDMYTPLLQSLPIRRLHISDHAPYPLASSIEDAAIVVFDSLEALEELWWWRMLPGDAKEEQGPEAFFKDWDADRVRPLRRVVLGRLGHYVWGDGPSAWVYERDESGEWVMEKQRVNEERGFEGVRWRF